LINYFDKFTRLRVNTAGGQSPHKPCLLLSVIDLVEAGALSTNEILYRPELTERFNDYFDAVRTDRDRPNIYMPFFHLRSEGFWHLQPLKGRTAILQAMRTAVKHSDIVENVSSVRLDDDLYELLQDKDQRQQLRAVLITHWFGDNADAVWAVVRRHQSDNEAEFDLRNRYEAEDKYQVKDSETPARSAAFRRVVLQAYDYRCAATGWRIFMPDGSSLIEAAHIMPFSESHNDDPRNGIALTPTFHVALDRNLIAPGPDMKWRVSSLFDRRIPDYRGFVDLEGRDVIYFGDERFRPKQSYLEKRVSMLREE
jgi:putative restriction endonuclease